MFDMSFYKASETYKVDLNVQGKLMVFAILLLLVLNNGFKCSVLSNCRTVLSRILTMEEVDIDHS